MMALTELVDFLLQPSGHLAFMIDFQQGPFFSALQPFFGALKRLALFLQLCSEVLPRLS